jgi:hypothetical protein
VKSRLWLGLALTACVVPSACSRSSTSSGSSASSSTTASTAAASSSKCGSTPLQATEVGITPTTITVEVMADVGSPLAPGLFQGNFDGVNAWAKYVNAHGGLACRKVVVRTWDSKLDPSESKDGLIDACSNAVAMVGNNALFNPDVSPMTGCVDKSGQATGLPDIAALANDIHEMCAPTAYVIQGVSETCPVTPGVPRPEKYGIGPTLWYTSHFTGLHGLYMIPADLPTTIQSATYGIVAMQQQGITFDATPKVYGADTQADYTPRVQIISQKNSNFVYDGSNDTAMIRIRKEAIAQGVTSVKVWACSIACYTPNELSQGGSAVNGTYVAMPFIPFEEANLNAQDEAYVSSVPSLTSWGAQAWQAGLAFEQVVNTIVAQSGPNAITRAAILNGLKNIGQFTADGWIGPTNLRGVSPCFMMMQIQNDKFVRIYPTKPGTFDCNPKNVVTIMIDPVAAAAKLQ